jgi:hypothetical protein
MFEFIGLIGVAALLCGNQAGVCAKGVHFQDVYAAIAQIEVIEVSEKVNSSNRPIVVPRPKPKLSVRERNANPRIAMVASNPNKPAVATKSRTSERAKVQIPILIGVYF